jgi:hypothetical protein
MSSLARLQHEIESTKHRATLARKASRMEADELIAVVALNAVAGVTGYLEREGKIPVAMFDGKVPTKMAVAAVSLAVALMTKGTPRKYAMQNAKLFSTLYSYNAGRSGSMVAGE